MGRRVSVADNGIEIGRLQIHMGEKRASNIKNHILDARFAGPDDESAQKSIITKQDTVGWKILRASLTSVNSTNKIGNRNSGINLIKTESRNSLNMDRAQLGLTSQRSSARLGGRSSYLNLDATIQEEGSENKSTQQPGWKKLRQSIKQKEFEQNLSLRKSNLRLHQMDECLIPRISNISTNSRNSKIIGRKSNAHDARDQMMGFRRMSVGDHRRQSLHCTLSNDLEIMRDLHKEKSKENSNKTCWSGIKYIFNCKKKQIWVE